MVTSEEAPGDSTTVISRQLFTASGVTTDFTFSSTYSVGYLDVYVNGVRLIANTDYLAQNGSTFSILNGGQMMVIESAVAYKTFNLGSAGNIGIQSSGML